MPEPRPTVTSGVLGGTGAPGKIPGSQSPVREVASYDSSALLAGFKGILPTEPHLDDQDWQFDPSEFDKLSRRVGGFSLDAASDNSGNNAHCERFCCERRSFLCQDLAGERVWANFPFRHLDEFLQRYFAQKEKHPEISGCFVVPVWKRSKWWPWVDKLPVLARYEKGTDLFTKAQPDGSRRSVGPTRWAVEVRYDPATRSGACAPATVAPDVADEGGSDASSWAHQAEPAGTDHPEQAEFWRVTVCNTDMESSPPPVADRVVAYNTARARDGPLPRLLHVKGRAAGRSATVFMDSGAQLDLVSSRFVATHHLKLEPPVFDVNMADGRGARLDGVVRNVEIKMGTYTVQRDLHVLDLKGRFDVLLGKGWHDDAEPQIA